MAEDLAAFAQAALAGPPDAVSDETIQALLTAGLRLYAWKVEQQQRHFLPITTRNAVTPTDVAVTVTELLRAVNLNLFDLSMWADRPRYSADDTGIP
ncbi:hypothetical protein [Plastoroseomonas arctica]|uniref:Uncharacterized protein n=1 Tax=Plastoroseomonas arctica TaxID=1509237 RepID=A0AAF1JUZ1_9PROT|nr:hypothetical protein [Plastoroseomonas arctica]MBR0654241.1 hypothetical protein [Plastoroseomonas arctica]